MLFKSGVSPKHLSSPAWFALWVADQMHREETGREVVCTSTGESKHSAERSRHYNGAWGNGFSFAFDLRIWYLSDPADFRTRLKKRLGKDFVVILEETHIHVHWAPTYG